MWSSWSLVIIEFILDRPSEASKVILVGLQVPVATCNFTVIIHIVSAYFLSTLQAVIMLLQRTAAASRSASDEPRTSPRSTQLPDNERPLTCMFFFFASQMQRNIQPADADLVRRGKVPNQPTHQLDTLLARVGMHAAHSPLISKFETFPVEIPAAASEDTNTLSSRDEIHDTVMMLKFRDRRAREQWIATREWQAFMRDTEAKDVFRRMPHVRCASSVRGLMDPWDSLTA